MKTKPLKSTALALLPAVLLTLGACSPTIPGEQDTRVKKTDTSTTVVETFKATATVTAIDANTRKLTLTFSDGSRKTVKCGPEVRNFNQIHINDRVNLLVTEEVAVFLDKNAKPGTTGSGVVALAPLGARPGVVMADTVQSTVRITAIDTATRKVTFVTRTGRSETVKASSHIDLTKVKVGDSVTIRQTEAVAISVEKP
jgi:hypothetical protein